MHSCLRVAEIQQRIFGDFAGMEMSRAGAATLAALAVTCRTFSDQALDELWRDQLNLAQLVRCMPDEMVHIVPFGHAHQSGIGETTEGDFCRCHGRYQLYFRRPPNARDLDRFNFYSRRVRAFGVCSRDIGCTLSNWEVDPTVIYSLTSLASSHNPLFPRLRTLEWDHPKPDAFLYLSTFISPHLTSLRIDFPCLQRKQFVGVLATIAMKCRNLVELDFKNTHYATDVQGDQFVRFLSVLCLDRLERITIHTDHLKMDKIFSLLAPLDRVRSLELRDTAEWFGDDEAEGKLTANSRRFFVPSTPAFTNLEFLHLHVHHLEPCVPLLENLHGSKLQSVSITYSAWVSPLVLHQCIDAISTRCTFALSELCLSQAEPFFPEEASDHHSFDGSVLRGLLPFPFIRKLQVDICSPVDLDNELLKDMAGAWPYLEELFVGANEELSNRSRVTLPGLIPFISRCRLLSTIGLPIDARVTEPLSRLHPVGLANDYITSISFGNSPIGNPNAVGPFLMTLFPRLRCIHAVDLDQEDSGGHVTGDGGPAIGWSAVSQMFMWLSIARREIESSMGRSVG
ncbi:hypothetical protein JAAARDRAFT_192531 [Jaapia argillacea MUCL 33604]|uniref:F-box domain-containing protein n=1 Tax=Jaapia argillacea MUCL 33604 TaxID=933084 RepID=A0A067PYM1_9AGAM|nr:hypothetical protein JAAARDRAFT_192531 [Jaapia argillacea MUCL 33604]